MEPLPNAVINFVDAFVQKATKPWLSDHPDSYQQAYFRYVIANEGYEESRGSFERDMDDLRHATHAAKLKLQVQRILMDNVRSSGGTVAAYDQQKAALDVYLRDLVVDLEYFGTAVVANLNSPKDRKQQPKLPQRWENEKRRATLLIQLLKSDLSGLAPQYQGTQITSVS